MKSIFRVILLCPLAALSALSARADGTVLSASFVNQYMFRGTRLGGPSFQPSVELDYGNLAFGIWASTPIADKVAGQSDPEIDPYASYTIIINDSLNIVPGFTFYDYPKAPTAQGYFRSTFEPDIALNYTAGYGIKLTPRLYYDVVLHSTTYEFSVTAATPLKALATELDWTASGGTFMTTDYFNGASPKEKNWGNYYLAGVAAPFAVTKDSKLTIGFAYTKGTDNFVKHGTFPEVVNPAAGGRGVVSLSYIYTY